MTASPLTSVFSSTVMAFMLAATAPAAGAHVGSGPSCENGRQGPAIATAQAELDQAPAVLEARFALADALSEQGCYAAAVHALEEGEQYHGRNQELQNRLRFARSLVSEQNYFDGLQKAEQAAQIKRNLFRCTKLSDLKACDAALAGSPDDIQSLSAKGDALLALNRPAEAVLVYRKASAGNNADESVQTRLRAAESKRQEMFLRCQNNAGDAALEACQLALLSGAGDEFAIQKRRAVLLQSSARASQALDAYIAASLLDASDAAVALAIVALTDSTERKDALAIGARGSALLTLGHPQDARDALREAVAIDPGLPHLKSRLAQAETLAGSERQRPRGIRLAQADPRQTSAIDVGAGQSLVFAANASMPRASEARPQRKYSNAEESGRSH